MYTLHDLSYVYDRILSIILKQGTARVNFNEDKLISFGIIPKKLIPSIDAKEIRGMNRKKILYKTCFIVIKS